jgi:putative oxidoreductase
MARLAIGAMVPATSRRKANHMNLPPVMKATHILLRIAAGFLFLHHGGQKLFGWFGGFGGDPGGAVALASLMGLAGILEFYGGIAILLGLLTRPVAFLLSGEMAVAYLKAHQSHGTWPIQNHGESAVLFSFIFLFLAAHGAGGLSLDALLHRRRGRIGENMPSVLRAPGPRPAPSTSAL